MDDEQIWRAFRQTGQPLLYLLYKAGKGREKEEARPGAQPRAGG